MLLGCDNSNPGSLTHTPSPPLFVSLFVCPLRTGQTYPPGLERLAVPVHVRGVAAGSACFQRQLLPRQHLPPGGPMDRLLGRHRVSLPPPTHAHTHPALFFSILLPEFCTHNFANFNYTRGHSIVHAHTCHELPKCRLLLCLPSHFLQALTRSSPSSYMRHSDA